jgi:hypothetical protein
MDEVTITLPRYAARYLLAMCEREREYINCLMDSAYGQPTIQTEASHDSLNQIECSLPSDL